MEQVKLNVKLRSDFTLCRMAKLRSELYTAESEFGSKACVYATGSYGRGEAGKDSDLDLFIASETIQVNREGRDKVRALNNLSEIVLKANLIHSTRRIGLPEFDGDGEYLRCYTIEDLVKSLGRPEDDQLNTFTARLLLLLESKPVLGDGVYGHVVEDVIAAYWRDYQDHKEEFIPSFLINDILRLWRTFCVNYEARTKTSPPEMKNKRRVKNYKLKHSRMLTCYSAILELLALCRRQGTVHPSDFEEVVGRTPIQRIERLMAAEDCSDAHDELRELLQAYEMFLERTAVGGAALAEEFGNNETHSVYMGEANEFGNKIYSALRSVGGVTPLYRHLVV